jgi:hypothetical protein
LTVRAPDPEISPRRERAGKSGQAPGFRLSRC